MNNSYTNISERRLLLRIIDLLIIFCSLFFAVNYLQFTYFIFSSNNVIKWSLLLSFYYIFFGEVFLLYDLDTSNDKYSVFRSILLTAFVTTIFYVFTPYISPFLPKNRLQIIYFFLLITIPVVVWRFLYLGLIVSPKYFKTVIFVGDSLQIDKVLKVVKEDNYHEIRAYFSNSKIDSVAGYKDIKTVSLTDFCKENVINEIIVSKDDLSDDVLKKLNEDLISLFQKGLNIISLESFEESISFRIPKKHLNNNFYKYLNFSKNNNNRFYLYTLRFFDIFFSILGLIILCLLIPFLLIGNIIGNRGSLFYSQKRVGLNGKVFSIYKLRSMVQNAEKNGAVWAQKNDVRITAFGKFLRNTRLDEIPQFFNILKGDMSIIGPRPERPEFVEELKNKISFYGIRNVVRPGLTGWAQVNYPYANTIEEQEVKLRYDLYYIKERNAFLDFKILIKTLTTVLFYRGQ